MPSADAHSDRKIAGDGKGASSSPGSTASITGAATWLKSRTCWCNCRIRPATQNVTRDVADGIVKQIKVEPEITPALAAHIKGEAERMKAANLIRTLPDWTKVLRPDLLAQAKAA